MEATSPKWTEGSDPSGLEELQTKALRPLRGDETLTTMNRHELKDIVARRIVDEHRKHGKSLADGNEWAAIAAAKIIGTLNDIGALAAAKEEANRLPHDNHSGGSSALIGNVKERWKELGYDNPDRVEERFRNDPWRLFYNGWIEGRVPLITGSERPTTGIDVEGVMRLVNEHDLLLFNTNRGRENFRKALEAYAEKGGDNLRTDTCEPDCRDHGGIEGCSCSECSTPLGPPVFMTYCGGCGKKVNWPEGTDMMPSEWAYPQRKDAEKEDSNLRKPWPYTPTEELARRVPPDTDK